MRCRQKRPRVGQSYPVKYWTVEANGRQFHQVFLLSIESGWQYELNGRWLDADDPRLKEPT